MIPFDDTPIAAIATAPGRGGIGVVRISGKDLSAFIEHYFGSSLTPRYAHLRPFRDHNGDTIDEGLVLYFKAPHSYTKEDILELQGHGGPAVLKRVLQSCLTISQQHHLNMRLALPGEFTQRAYLNGQLDLAQAEAIADLIDAGSESAAKSAMSSLKGDFSKQINQLSEQIVHLRMLVEATLDFPEEEIEFLEKYQASQRLLEIQQHLQKVLTISRQGLILREGLHIVLAGQPNVGKSSLLNALAGDDVAIVTPIAGTTRDRVVEQIQLEGIPLHIIDTAGLRQTDDEVERIGIERSWQEIAKADVILHLQDPCQDSLVDVQAIRARMPKHVPIINVINKIDLLSPEQLQSMQAKPTTSSDTEVASLFISVKEGTHLEQLKQRLLQLVGWHNQQETPWLARERHINALIQANEHLEMAAQHAQFNDRVLDLFAEELRLAHEALMQITGEFSSDELLGEIFSSFCIGK
ncbi:tRNA uridine-5-carboxymethylaminomethyl(34) synthesis GTPase MnmE [Brackiella oedipodis]|uniref:tRNA uridine-5-carboxymethylaminomethyl(34) synthesis GTPase MnmE n=1 Tax=Brackiella oedipodis TaxID=124225 RepID=UPI00048ADE2B|nr:tRNA uridine-5-carboxymethylaminomethyl(34) synthesis GTPase MnmE [Brackiella oedipodis]